MARRGRFTKVWAKQNIRLLQIEQGAKESGAEGSNATRLVYYITNLIATGMMSIEAPDCEMCQVTNIMMSCHIKYINSPPRTQVKRRLTDVYRWALLVSICTSS